MAGTAYAAFDTGWLALGEPVDRRFRRAGLDPLSASNPLVDRFDAGDDSNRWTAETAPGGRRRSAGGLTR